MKAMVLAAGGGTRFRPFTYELPKPMIPVLGRPVMEYLLSHLAGQGVREVMVNTSHLGDRIERYFGDGRRLGLEIGYSFEGVIANGQVIAQPLGSAGGMKRIQDRGGFFDATALVICGDAIVDVDLAAALAEHRARGALASLIAARVPPSRLSSYGVVLADGDGRIRAFQEKPAPGTACSDWVNTGIYLFEPAVLDLIPADTVYDIGGDLFPRLVREGLPFYAQRRPFGWTDMGKVSDYWAILQAAMRGEVPGVEMPGRRLLPGLWAGLNVRIDPSARIEGPVYLGSGTCVEAGACIDGPAWIGHGSHVCRGARVTRSIVFEHTRIAPGARVHEQILYGDYGVSHDGSVARRAEAPLGAVWDDARAPLLPA